MLLAISLFLYLYRNSRGLLRRNSVYDSSKYRDFIAWIDDNVEGIQSEIEAFRNRGYGTVWYANDTEAIAEFRRGLAFVAFISDIRGQENGRKVPTAGLRTLQAVRRVAPQMVFYFYTSRENAVTYREQALRLGGTGITADPAELARWFESPQTLTNYNPADRVRPLRPGYAIQDSSRVTGTISAFVRTADGQIAILSAAHVLRNPGNVFQPSAIKPEDRVATLPGSQPREIFGNVALVMPGISVDSSLPDGTSISGIAEYVQLGARLKMFGYGSRASEGTVIGINVTVQVSDEKGSVPLEDVITTSIKPTAGDSGAPVLTLDNRLVGILWGGSVKESLVIPIQRVLDQLRVRLLPSGVITVPADTRGGAQTAR